MATGDVVNTALAPAVGRARRRHPRRRDDVPRDLDGDRVPRRRARAGEGQVRAGAASGRSSRCARASASTSPSAAAPSWSAARRSCACSAMPLAAPSASARRSWSRSSERPASARAACSSSSASALDDDPLTFVYWRQGRSLPYGEGVSFWALGEMVKAQAGILESDASEAAEEKLRTAVTAVIPDEPEASWVLEQLRPLVGLGRSRARRRRPPPRGLRRLAPLLRGARRAASARARLRGPALGRRRPARLRRPPGRLGLGRSDPRRLHVAARAARAPARLGRRQAQRADGLALAALRRGDAAADRRAPHGAAGAGRRATAELLAHAGGNPLYAEEYVRMLAEPGADAGLPLPETVQGIIAARLDTLAREEKALVQDAAVVGKVFWVGALEALAERPRAEVEEGLLRLERKEFVRRERRSSVAGETAFVFRHILVRDVAYSQIPRTRRADAHRLAAAWLEGLAGDRAEDLADLIAHHYLSALQFARAAEPGARRPGGARPPCPRSRPATARSRSPPTRPAVRFYREALASWPEDDAERPAPAPPLRPGALPRRGRRRRRPGRGSRRAARRRRAGARRRGRGPARGPAHDRPGPARGGGGALRARRRRCSPSGLPPARRCACWRRRANFHLAVDDAEEALGRGRRGPADGRRARAGRAPGAHALDARLLPAS